jgi:6-phosphogluconolactonase (cycloisomerase 2 family)
MRSNRRLALPLLAAVLAALSAGAGSAAAAGGRPLFVQTDGLTGNQIAVYDRSASGALSPAATYATGGLGGQLEGSVVDHLASQGSLTLDRAHDLLFAVNAGSNTVSVFGVFGDRLALRQTIPSGGSFPVSVAVQDGLVYVLNAGGGGSLQGFRVAAGRLSPLAESSRSLGLDPAAKPQFVNAPGQVGFSPDGSQLLVTTKANGSAVDVFAVDSLGRLSASPAVNSLPGAVPFAFAFDRLGHLVLTEAGPNAVATFALRSDGGLEQLDVVPTGQAATCWVVRGAGHFYASNAGSGSVSILKQGARGNLLTLVGQAATDGGTVDATVPTGDRFLYVQAGGPGTVDGYSIGLDGALTPIGAVTVPGAVGGEGIVAP